MKGGAVTGDEYTKYCNKYDIGYTMITVSTMQ